MDQEQLVDEEKNASAGASRNGGEDADSVTRPTFTPGPWKVSPIYWANSPYDPPDKPKSVCSYSVKDTLPVPKEQPGMFAGDIYHEPNARLVAAAPALYSKLLKIYYDNEAACGCECAVDTCCVLMGEPCSKCDARAALSIAVKQ